MNLQEDIMWVAVQSCDANYDGQFFYAVKTTKIFCKPSCKSKTPVRENVIYFPLYSMAINERFRPCKRCRPDLLEPPNEEDVILTAQSIIEKEYASALTLDQLSKQVGMSKYHLHRTFKKIVGVTPMEYMTKIRISKSAELLMQTDLSITQIAHEVGYRSSSHFNVMFRNHLGCSPTVYRHQQHKGD